MKKQFALLAFSLLLLIPTSLISNNFNGEIQFMQIDALTISPMSGWVSLAGH